MSEQFYTILTKQGKAKIANATALGDKVNLSKFQVGDGGGSYYNPSEDQIKLRNKVWEGNISSITVDKSNPNWIVLEVIIPHDVGGFMIREAGVFDDSGNLMAIGKYPETYKPVVDDGSTKDLIIKMILEVSNTSSVTLKVDPTVILATQKDIQILNNKIGNIKIPVQSVNGKTGAIELKAEDIKTKDGTNLEEFKKKTNSQYEDFKNIIGNKKNLKTSSKDNLVEAINSVFTLGNNVKSNIVDALLQKDKSLQISKENKWEEIIKNIGKITFSQQLKWAKGFKNNTENYNELNVNNLDFKPKIVIIWGSNDFCNTFEITTPDFEIFVSKKKEENSINYTHEDKVKLQNLIRIQQTGFSIFDANLREFSRLNWYAIG